MKKEVVELQRGDQVASFCGRAEEQMQSGDIAGAYKTLELASRLDAGNNDIERMMKKVKPKFEANEARRKSGLSQIELFKEKGDEAYKVSCGIVQFAALFVIRTYLYSLLASFQSVSKS
jgi:hypothetical protein